VKHRYSLEPIAALLEVPLSSLGRRLNLSGSTWKEYRDRGVSEKVADRLAVKVGVHPHTLWPEMLDHALADVDKAEEERRKKVNARKAAAARRKYAEDAEFRARRLADMRAYKEASRRAQRLYAERHRAANRERLAAQRRANYEANRERILERQRAYDRARAAARALTCEDTPDTRLSA